MTNTVGSLFTRLPRYSWWALAGLVVGIVGLVIQAIADPDRFGAADSPFGIPFPPGILFIVGAGVLTILTSRWRWHPVFAVLIGVWIVGVGIKFTLANFASPNPGTVVGTAVMALGLLASVITGIAAIAAPAPPARERRREA